MGRRAWGLAFPYSRARRPLPSFPTRRSSDLVGVVGPRLDVARFSRHVVPLAPVDPDRPTAGPAHSGVVLLRAAHAVGKVVGRRDVIELRGGVVLIAPRLATVERHVRAAVVRL